MLSPPYWPWAGLSLFQGTGAALDAKVSGAMHPLSSEVIKACLPDGQRKPFRTNMLSLMTGEGGWAGAGVGVAVGVKYSFIDCNHTCLPHSQ